jgi:alpha-L-arabinofuranosidase
MPQLNAGNLTRASGRWLAEPTGKVEVTSTLRARKTSGAEGFLIGFKARDAANYQWWNLGGWDNTRDAVEKSVDGARRMVGDDKPLKIELNRWYDIRVEVAGTRIKCYLNGELRHDFVDAGVEKSPDFAVSSVRDGHSGDLILKVVNGAPSPKPLRIELDGAGKLAPHATMTVLAGDPLAVNDSGHPNRLGPKTTTIPVAPAFDYEAPANSLTVLRIPAQ